MCASLEVYITIFLSYLQQQFLIDSLGRFTKPPLVAMEDLTSTWCREERTSTISVWIKTQGALQTVASTMWERDSNGDAPLVDRK